MVRLYIRYNTSGAFINNSSTLGPISAVLYTPIFVLAQTPAFVLIPVFISTLEPPKKYTDKNLEKVTILALESLVKS